MLLQQTLDTLQALRLGGMSDALRGQLGNALFDEMSFEERLGLLVDAEAQARTARRVQLLVKRARFKVNACAEDIDYRALRGLDRSVFASLLSCDWVTTAQHVLITGPTGVGKTWLACALGQQAARKSMPVLYKRLPRLLEALALGHADGSIASLRGQLAKTRLLILDDWAIAPLTGEGRQDLLEIIDDRAGVSSVLITSQLPVDKWHGYIGDATLADAILDRLVHNAHRIELRGESLRKTRAAGGGV